LIVFFLSSCEEKKPYLVSITNNSTKKVSYVYNNIFDTLLISETKIYEVWEPYTQKPKDIVDQNGVASLKIKTNNMTGDYTFLDAEPLDLNVINRLPIDITIKADNYIDNNGSIELAIDSNSESTGAKIYTKSPKFTSNTNYPIIFEYAVVGNEMSVIVR